MKENENRVLNCNLCHCFESSNAEKILIKFVFVRLATLALISRPLPGFKHGRGCNDKTVSFVF